MVSVNRSLPTRSLREQSDLNQLKRQAKELLRAFKAGEPGAVAEVNAHYRDADPASFALHDAQLVLARAYGFDSWPKLRAYVDGATATRLAEAVRAGDIEQVRAMLKARPELVHMDMAANNEHRALHYAVLGRAPEMVRLLMECGADARKGIYPHRDATGAMTLAKERGYDEIVAIIEEEEQQRRGVPSTADELAEAIRKRDVDGAIAILERDLPLIRATNRNGSTPLHLAAAMREERLVTWLLEHGADVNRRGPGERTPLDHAVGAGWRTSGDNDRFATVAELLRQRGAELTARSAAALGEAEWLRARQAEGALVNPIEDWGGLLTVAVQFDQPKILELLLDLGFDPNERKRVDDLEEVEFSAGMPLWWCAQQGRHAMAEMLLKRGADPNAQVYASGSAVHSAYGQGDWEMVKLLERYGGAIDAISAGLYRLTELAKGMLTGEVDPRLSEGHFAGDTAAEQLLWGGACGGDPEIVRMALKQIDWPRNDPRWYTMLEQPLRLWSHGDGLTHLTCFRLLVERCDVNVRGRFGLTILHDVAASRRHVTEEQIAGFAKVMLDAGARLDPRDDLLKSTPLGWACRWGRVELVKLLLSRGADPVEHDAEPWAMPHAWAQKMGHNAVLALLA